MTEIEIQKMVADRVKEIINICTESYHIDYIADYLGVSKPSIYAYCEGRRFPSTLFIHNLSTFTGVSADYLLGLTELQIKT